MKRLALGLDEARRSRSRIGKERALADALVAIALEPDGRADKLGGAKCAGAICTGAANEGSVLATAARLAVGRTLPVGDGRSLGTGWSLMLEVGARLTGFDAHIVGACTRRAGDFGDALGLLMARVEGADQRPGLALREVEDLFEVLASSGQRLAKRRALEDAFARATPLEIKYLSKALLGELRVGAQAGVVEGAIARAFHASLEDVRRAAGLVTDPGALAVLARDKRLAEARFELGRPVAFMLATPIEAIATPILLDAFVIEDKIDGVRAQLHKTGDEVVLFARGLDRVRAAFPEILEAFRGVPGGFALDGEVVAVAPDGRPRPFQALQARLRRLLPSPELVADTPVTFIAYDMLHEGTRDLLPRPWAERREALEAFARERAPKQAFVLHPVKPFSVASLPSAPEVPATADPSSTTASAATAAALHLLDADFSAARARGHEGLVLKRVDAPYEAGRRGQAWIEIKRAYATLDVVITAAEEGHGRRAGVLSDYTFGVWKAGDLVNIGKAYSGLNDPEVDALSRRLFTMAVGHVGRVRLVPPAIVLEVAFDGVQTSTRHNSGFALRFPRIVRVRDDKQPHEADCLDAVEALFHAQVAEGHREHAGAKPSRKGRKKRPAEPERQLSLFDPPKEGN